MNIQIILWPVRLVCVLAIVLAPMPLCAGTLDPQPLGEEFCLLDEVFHPSGRAHFVVELGDAAQSFVLAHKPFESEQLLAQLYDRDATPVGPEIVVDEPFVGEQFLTNDIASHPPSGRWLATWEGHGSPGGDNNLTSVKARLFDADGTPLGLSFQVNTTEVGVQSDPKTTFLADGSFVVVFEDDPISPSVFEVRARVFDAAGVALGDDLLVTAGPIEGLFPDVVASPSGGFLVVYLAFNAALDALGLGVSEHLADGTLVASSVVPIKDFDDAFMLTTEVDTEGALRVATAVFVGKGAVIRLFKLRWLAPFWRWTETQIAPGGGAHLSPDLLPTADGGVSLVWLNNPTNTVGEGTNSVLRFSASNKPVSEVIDFNGVDPTRAAGNSDAALLGSGRAIAIWENPANPGSCDLLARFFHLPEVVFADGFEGGDTSAWSNTVP